MIALLSDLSTLACLSSSDSSILRALTVAVWADALPPAPNLRSVETRPIA